MFACEPVLTQLVVAGLSASGHPLVQAVRAEQTSSRLSTLGTSSSFHRIESFGKFIAEESLECDCDIIVESAAIAGIVGDAEQSDLVDYSNLISDGSDLIATGGVNVVREKEEQHMNNFKPINEHTVMAANVSSGTAPLLSDYEQRSMMSIIDSGAIDVSALLERLQLALSVLQMSSPDRHTAALCRLRELELELNAAGAICPSDDADTVGTIVRALAQTDIPNADVQIRVQTTRQTNSTKSVLNTEMPSMSQLDPLTVQKLQQQLITNMSAPSAATGDSQAKDAAHTVTDQKHESMAEGFTSDDGTVVVSKKMTRIVTTTRTAAPGDLDPNAGDLIRLKVNEKVYSGSVNPSDQHIHLVPIITKQSITATKTSTSQQSEQA